MEHIPGPKTSAVRPDRFLNCQEAMADAFCQLAERAMAAGWREDEVAGALVDLADCHMLALASNLDIERLIAEAIKSRR